MVQSLEAPLLQVQEIDTWTPENMKKGGAWDYSRCLERLNNRDERLSAALKAVCLVDHPSLFEKHGSQAFHPGFPAVALAAFLGQAPSETSEKIISLIKGFTTFRSLISLVNVSRDTLSPDHVLTISNKIQQMIIDDFAENKEILFPLGWYWFSQGHTLMAHVKQVESEVQLTLIEGGRNELFMPEDAGEGKWMQDAYMQRKFPDKESFTQYLKKTFFFQFGVLTEGNYEDFKAATEAGRGSLFSQLEKVSKVPKNSVSLDSGCTVASLRGLLLEIGVEKANEQFEAFKKWLFEQLKNTLNKDEREIISRSSFKLSL